MNVVDEPTRHHDGETTPAPSSEVVAEELRALLGIRSRSSIRDRHLPALLSLIDPDDAGQRDRRYLALVRLIDEGIGRIADVNHREAARALLGSGEGRWRTVAQRGAEAAARFDCGWDAYRRRRTSGTSQLDDTLGALAERLLLGDLPNSSPATPERSAAPDPPAADHELAGTDAPPAPVASFSRESPGPASPPATEPVTVVIGDPAREGAGVRTVLPVAPSRTSPRRWGRLVLVTLVGIGAVTAVAALAIRSKDRPAGEDRVTTTAPPATCAGLTRQVGDVPPGASEELRAWAGRFREAARSIDPPPTCAGYVVNKWDMVFQPVSNGLSNGRGLGAIVGVEGDGGKTQVVVLTHSQFFALRSAVEQYGPGYLGRLVRRADTKDFLVAEFTNGKVISESIDGVTFSVVGPTWRFWEEKGGLSGEMGAPVSGAYDDARRGRVQEFTNGDVVVSYRDGSITWHPVDDPASALPETPREYVLVQRDGTAWMVDGDSVRHWIPSEADFVCATGLGFTLVDEVPGWALATLPDGPYFTCR